MPAAAPRRGANVATAAEALAADERAIASGIPARALMQRAGAAAAAEIARAFPELRSAGALVVTGSGNNGGDGWVVASSLHAVGIRVRVVEIVAARTPDAVAERAHAVACGVSVEAGAGAIARGGDGVIVDALLGTGSHGAPRDAIADAVEAIAARRTAGAPVVSLDLPSGLDADTGDTPGAVRADHTLAFGTLKRGLLVARGHCGTITCLDIGLGGLTVELPFLADDAWFRATVPCIAADAHKGTRRHVAIVGGAEGMAGAVILAARAALRSGAGLVRCLVAPASVAAVQAAEPAAMTTAWPANPGGWRDALGEWADAVLVGPGLGRDGARLMVEHALGATDAPVVLDADALNAFAGAAGALAPHIGAREALLTPHPAEFARLAGLTVAEVLRTRFDAPHRLARATGSTVLLKGVPTVVGSALGATTVIAEGTPILATGGAGDVLGGIAAALLAVTGDAAAAGALAAFAHGRAAAALSARQVRGWVIDDVVAALPTVWALEPRAPRPPVLAELPAVGEPG